MLNALKLPSPPLESRGVSLGFVRWANHHSKHLQEGCVREYVFEVKPDTV